MMIYREKFTRYLSQLPVQLFLKINKFRQT